MRRSRCARRPRLPRPSSPFLALAPLPRPLTAHETAGRPVRARSATHQAARADPATYDKLGQLLLDHTRPLHARFRALFTLKNL